MSQPTNPHTPSSTPPAALATAAGGDSSMSRKLASDPRYYWFLVAFLVAESALGSFVNDMYSPALPAMCRYFGCQVPIAQMGLTMGMIGLALGQVILGPVSDRYGRKQLSQACSHRVGDALYHICSGKPLFAIYPLLQHLQAFSGPRCCRRLLFGPYCSGRRLLRASAGQAHGTRRSYQRHRSCLRPGDRWFHIRFIRLEGCVCCACRICGLVAPARSGG